MTDLKKCIGDCGLEKEETLSNFYWLKNQNRFDNKCKICVLKTNKQYYEKNKNNVLNRQKKYRNENKESRAEYQKEYQKEHKNSLKEYNHLYHIDYYQENKEYLNEKARIYNKQRRINNINFKLKQNISSLIREKLKGKKNGKSTLKHLPYTMEELREHIEKQFSEPGNEWMNWDNWGVYNRKTYATNPTWNLDHKTPHSRFKYEDMDCQEFQECWALSNLRPYSSKKNVEEGDRR